MCISTDVTECSQCSGSSCRREEHRLMTIYFSTTFPIRRFWRHPEHKFLIPRFTLHPPSSITNHLLPESATLPGSPSRCGTCGSDGSGGSSALFLVMVVYHHDDDLTGMRSPEIHSFYSVTWPAFHFSQYMYTLLSCIRNQYCRSIFSADSSHQHPRRFYQHHTIKWAEESRN